MCLAIINYDVRYLNDIIFNFKFLDKSESPKIKNLGNVYALMMLINDFVNTPIKKRFPVKKYRVRLKGLNSDNGHQYLNCRDVTGRIFACALRENLKQKFTMDEINYIANQPNFKSTLWLKDLLHDGLEEVKYGE